MAGPALALLYVAAVAASAAGAAAAKPPAETCYDVTWKTLLRTGNTYGRGTWGALKAVKWAGLGFAAPSSPNRPGDGVRARCRLVHAMRCAAPTSRPPPLPPPPPPPASPRSGKSIGLLVPSRSAAPVVGAGAVFLQDAELAKSFQPPAVRPRPPPHLADGWRWGKGRATCVHLGPVCPGARRPRT
jgi:hypothetical protein